MTPERKAEIRARHVSTPIYTESGDAHLAYRDRGELLEALDEAEARIEQLRNTVDDVSRGRRWCVYAWDSETKRMGYWLLPAGGWHISGPSYTRAIEAIEAEQRKEAP